MSKFHLKWAQDPEHVFWARSNKLYTHLCWICNCLNRQGSDYFSHSRLIWTTINHFGWLGIIFQKAGNFSILAKALR